MKKTLNFCLAFFLTMLFTSCGNTGNSTNSTTTNDDVSDSLETGVVEASSTADDTAASVAITSIEINEVYADAGANCTVTVGTCSSGVKTKTVTCDNLTKNITMTFYNADATASSNCKIDTAGKYFIRTKTVTRTNSRGTFTATSDPVTNYEGTSITGGVKVTRNADATFSIEILGMNKKLVQADGTEKWNHSIISAPSSTLIANKFQRDGRIISTGSLIVYHNKALFTATMVFDNVSYTNDCCYPVGGTITSTFTGSKTGTRTVTFSSTCGEATVTATDGTTTTLNMTTCENSTSNTDAAQ